MKFVSWSLLNMKTLASSLGTVYSIINLDASQADDEKAEEVSS